MNRKYALFRILYILIFVITLLILYAPNVSLDASMKPGVGVGDLIISYKLNKNYSQNDLTVYKKSNHNELRRVVAVAGDTVDIKNSTLVVNGYEQAEDHVLGPTNAYFGKTKFPLTLKKGEVFLLADNRSNASDSRDYGPVNVKDTNGVVLVVIRHKGL